MECQNKFTLPPGQKIVFIGCPKEHMSETSKETNFDCGESFKWSDCEVDHIWRCTKCTSEIPKGKGLQHSLTRPTSTTTNPPLNKNLKCANSVDFKPQDKIRFAGCSHVALKKESIPCGTNMKYPTTECKNEVHIVKCTTCFECKNTIQVSEITEHAFVPDCDIKHCFGPDVYNCGQRIDFASCKNDHFIWCQECWEEKKTVYNPSTSTPARPNTLNELQKQVLNLSRVVDDNVVEDKKVDKISCLNKQHLFESRTRKFLSAPARTFMQAYRTCKYHFENNEAISKDFGDEILKDLIDAFKEVERIRLFCLEPFSDKEIFERGYEDYMDIRLDQLNECQKLHNQFFKANEIEHELQQRTNNLSILQQNHPTAAPRKSFLQTIPEVPQPMEDALSYRAPLLRSSQTKIPIKYRDPNPFGSTVQHPPILENRKYFKLQDEIKLIEKFDANKPREYMAFRNQWSNFEKKLIQNNRSELDKYYSLMSVLANNAKDLVATRYPNDYSYTTALEKLDKLFFDQANLLREMIRNLLKCSKMQDSYESLLKGMSQLWTAWQDLDQANLSVSQLKGLLFIAATEKNLPDSAWQCWLDIQNAPQHMANPLGVFEITSYMNAIETAVSNAQKRQNAFGSERPKSHNKMSTLYGSYNITTQPQTQSQPNQRLADNMGKCVFCGDKLHTLQLTCRALRGGELNPNEIYDIMKKYQINCRLCLTLGHQTHECPSYEQGLLRKCFMKDNGITCDKLHCKFLHKSKSKFQPRNTGPSKFKPNNFKVKTTPVSTKQEAVSKKDNN